MHVFLEILVVMGVKEHPTLKPFIVDLLQGDRSGEKADTRNCE